MKTSLARLGTLSVVVSFVSATLPAATAESPVPLPQLLIINGSPQAGEETEPGPLSGQSRTLFAGHGAGAIPEGQVLTPPDGLGIPRYYAKFISAGGYPIVASERVNDYALREAAWLVNQMLAHRPDVREALIRSGSRLCLIGHDEFTTDLPEFSMLEAPPEFADVPATDYWDARARGTGGSDTDPCCSCGEENLLGYPGDPYATENILIHEFAHTMHLRGMNNADPTFDARVQEAYGRALAQGLWRGTYASVNHCEYLAEGVQCWFDNNREHDHDHNHVNTRAELCAYDPGLAALCREMVGDDVRPYTKPATRLADHLAGYDPATAPTFAWPARLQQAHAVILRHALQRTEVADAAAAQSADAAAGSADAAPAPEPAAQSTPQDTVPHSYDVRHFGAVGDGQTSDTGALQQAIDTCAAHGGGTVVLDKGRFLTGTLVLRSHVQLHLTSTAVLLGATDLAQYRADPQVVYKLINQALIFAEACEHVGISGAGTIDGQGKAFANGAEDPRPVLIRLRDCRHVTIRDVLVKDGASFAVHPIHCQQVRIEGLRIDSRVQPNSDGIDVDGCQDVFISNCHIHSGDDSIALKVIEPGAPCRDVVITNCILSSDCAAIRVGPDAVENIERVCVSNCVIRDTRLNGVKIQMAFGVVMRDMVFSNLVMDNVTGPISLRLAGWKLGANEWAVFDDSKWEQGELRNILFDNIRASVPADQIKSCISITGTSRTRPRAITMSNFDVTFAGGGTAAEGARREVPDLEQAYPECFIFGVLPAYGFYAHHAQDLTLHNVRFRLASEDLRPAIVCDDVQHLTVNGFQADGHPQAESLIRLQNTRAALLTAVRVPDPLGTFLRVEGGESQRIRLLGNDLELASEATSVSPEAPSDAVSAQ